MNDANVDDLMMKLDRICDISAPVTFSSSSALGARPFVSESTTTTANITAAYAATAVDENEPPESGDVITQWNTRGIYNGFSCFFLYDMLQRLHDAELECIFVSTFMDRPVHLKRTAFGRTLFRAFKRIWNTYSCNVVDSVVRGTDELSLRSDIGVQNARVALQLDSFDPEWLFEQPVDSFPAMNEKTTESSVAMRRKSAVVKSDEYDRVGDNGNSNVGGSGTRASREESSPPSPPNEPFATAALAYSEAILSAIDRCKARAVCLNTFFCVLESERSARALSVFMDPRAQTLKFARTTFDFKCSASPLRYLDEFASLSQGKTLLRTKNCH